MKYRNLSDDASEKAWEDFLRAEEEYRRDPKNREKYMKARAAFNAYDTVRVQIYFPDDKQ